MGSGISTRQCASPDCNHQTTEEYCSRCRRYLEKKRRRSFQKIKAYQNVGKLTCPKCGRTFPYISIYGTIQVLETNIRQFSGSCPDCGTFFTQNLGEVP